MLEDGERLAAEIFGPDPRVRGPAPLRHPDERSPYPSDYFFAIGVTAQGICYVILTARRYWASSHAQSDWHLEDLIGHALPRGFEEVTESTFETSFGTDGTRAALIQLGFLEGPPDFQEYFGCTVPDHPPHPEALQRDAGFNPPAPPPPPSPAPATRRSRVTFQEDDAESFRWPSRRGVVSANKKKKANVLTEPKKELPRPTAWQHILGDDPYEDD